MTRLVRHRRAARRSSKVIAEGPHMFAASFGERGQLAVLTLQIEALDTERLTEILHATAGGG